MRVALAGLATLCAVFAVLTGLSLLRARSLERQRRELTADVGLLQSALLPTLTPEIAGTAVSAAYRPADGPGAGGDFYDAFPLPGNRTGVIVGDIEGHGRQALPLTALVRYTVRGHLESGLEPRLALQFADAVLSSQLGGRMVTVVAGVFDPETGRLTYACAGHPQPVIIGHDQPPVGAAASPPLGTGVTTGRRQVTVRLSSGTAACFYSDGISDITPRGERSRLGFERLTDHLHTLSADSTADAILEPLLRGARQPDDVTVCVLRPVAEPAQAPHIGSTEQLELADDNLAGARQMLDECGVDPADADAVLREAAHVIADAGSALLEVDREPGGATARVRSSAVYERRRSRARG